MSTNDLIKQLSKQREQKNGNDKLYSKLKADTIVGGVGVIIYFITLLFAGNSVSTIVSSHYLYVISGTLIIISTIMIDIKNPKNDIWRIDTIIYFIYFIQLTRRLYITDINVEYDASYLFILYPIIIALVIASTFSFLANHNKTINKKKLLNNSQEDVFYRGMPPSISGK